MIWWCRARLLVPVLLPGLLTFALGLVVARDDAIALPSFFNAGGNRIAFVQVLPLMVSSTLAYAMTQRLTEAEALARRPIALLDTGLSAAAGFLALAASVTVWHFGGSQESLAAGRNTLFLIGLMLIAARINSQAATLTPVAWMFAMLFIGFKDHHRPWFWAVTLHRADFAPTFALCALVFIAGLATNLSSRSSFEKA
ncbi:hypothetical protein ACFC18_26470 [Streptomyces sp. NPDC056121]|uniref:hypothetical protein n=1 Tax=unclassified Streptomyces TaxID=2593676 RepID=UPI0035DB3B8A